MNQAPTQPLPHTETTPLQTPPSPERTADLMLSYGLSGLADRTGGLRDERQYDLHALRKARTLPFIGMAAENLPTIKTAADWQGEPWQNPYPKAGPQRISYSGEAHDATQTEQERRETIWGISQLLAEKARASQIPLNRDWRASNNGGGKFGRRNKAGDVLDQGWVIGSVKNGTEIVLLEDGGFAIGSNPSDRKVDGRAVGVESPGSYNVTSFDVPARSWRTTLEEALGVKSGFEAPNSAPIYQSRLLGNTRHNTSGLGISLTDLEEMVSAWAQAHGFQPEPTAPVPGKEVALRESPQDASDATGLVAPAQGKAREVASFNDEREALQYMEFSDRMRMSVLTVIGGGYRTDFPHTPYEHVSSEEIAAVLADKLHVAGGVARVRDLPESAAADPAIQREALELAHRTTAPFFDQLAHEGLLYKLGDTNQARVVANAARIHEAIENKPWEASLRFIAGEQSMTEGESHALRQCPPEMLAEHLLSLDELALSEKICGGTYRTTESIRTAVATAAMTNQQAEHLLQSVLYVANLQITRMAQSGIFAPGSYDVVKHSGFLRAAADTHVQLVQQQQS